MTDSQGALTHTIAYDPYGVPYQQDSLVTTSLGFTGEYTDAPGYRSGALRPS
jgi:hypothetical protein